MNLIMQVVTCLLIRLCWQVNGQDAYSGINVNPCTGAYPPLNYLAMKNILLPRVRQIFFQSEEGTLRRQQLQLNVSNQQTQVTQLDYRIQLIKQALKGPHAAFPGPVGLPGPRGMTGASGSPGSYGNPGNPGSSGLQGFPGSAGPPGGVGATGAPGGIGRPGPRGLTGATGPWGEIGFPGVPGPQGIPGGMGYPGAIGASGQSGLPGPMGATGPRGPSACLVDVVFVIDDSGSIADKSPSQTDYLFNWRLVIQFVQRLVNLFNVGKNATHVGVVIFDTDSNLEFNLTAYQTAPEVNQAVGQIRYRDGPRNTAAGLRLGRQVLTQSQNGARDLSIPKVMIFITDGNPTIEPEAVPGELDAINSVPIRVAAVGITPEVNETLMRSIATSPSDYTYLDDFYGLGRAADTIINENTCRPITTT